MQLYKMVSKEGREEEDKRKNKKIWLHLNRVFFPRAFRGKSFCLVFFSFLFRHLLPLVPLLSLRHYDHLLRPLSCVPILSFLKGIWGIEVILICFMFFFSSLFFRLYHYDLPPPPLSYYHLFSWKGFTLFIHLFNYFNYVFIYLFHCSFSDGGDFGMRSLRYLFFLNILKCFCMESIQFSFHPFLSSPFFPAP